MHGFDLLGEHKGKVHQRSWEMAIRARDLVSLSQRKMCCARAHVLSTQSTPRLRDNGRADQLAQLFGPMPLETS